MNEFGGLTAHSEKLPTSQNYTRSAWREQTAAKDNNKTIHKKEVVFILDGYFAYFSSTQSKTSEEREREREFENYVAANFITSICKSEDHISKLRTSSKAYFLN